MDSNSQDRQLPASARKLQKAREEGQVPRSRDLANVAVVGGGCLALLWLAPWFWQSLQQEFRLQLIFDARSLQDPNQLVLRLGTMTQAALLGAGTLGLIVTLLALGAALASGGWVLSLKPMSPDLSKLDPLAGLGRLFSKDKATEVAKVVALSALMLWVGYSYLSNGLDTLAGLARLPADRAIDLLVQWLKTGAGWMLLVMLLMALIDLPLQRHLHLSRLKMSHQEVKQEHKESEGNPQVKGKLRQRARELAHAASVKAVPKADFVLMNPTHYAVALRYDESSMSAPRVIAKGADWIALRIRELARQHQIPVLQSPPLARALYTHAELDHDIPASLFTAVAQVLAYIYRLKAALSGQAPMPLTEPTPYVPPELDPLSGVVAES